MKIECEIEGVERRRKRHVDSNHCFHNDEEEHVFRPRRSQRREKFRNHMPRRDKDEEEHGFIPR